MGKGCLAEKHMKDLVKVIQSTLQEHSARQDERQGTAYKISVMLRNYAPVD